MFLPRAETWNPYADEGKEEHEALSNFDSLTPGLKKHIPRNAKSEVKVAYNVETDTARIIGYGSDRNYGIVGPNEIAGSIDVEGHEDGKSIVLDYKTGYQPVEPAKSNLQILFYALAAARIRGNLTATASILYTRSEVLDSVDLDPLDLLELAGNFRALHRRSKSKAPTPLRTAEGSWCKYCPSKHVCPSKTGLITQLVRAAHEGEEMVSMKGNVALAYFLLRSIESIARNARNQLNRFVDENGPIDIGSGMSYGRYARPGNERVNGTIAASCVDRLPLDEPAVKAIKESAFQLSTSKAALIRGMKSAGIGPAGVKTLFSEIRKAGGISNLPDTLPLGEFKSTEVGQLSDAVIDEANGMLGKA